MFFKGMLSRFKVLICFINGEHPGQTIQILKTYAGLKIEI